MEIPVLTRLRPPPPPKKKAECIGLFYTYTRKRWRVSSAGFLWTESLRLLASVSCPGCYVCRKMLKRLAESPEALRLPADCPDWAHLKASWSSSHRKYVDLTPTRDLPPRRRKDSKPVKNGV